MTKPAATGPLTDGYEDFLRQISSNDPSSAHAHFARAALDAHIAGDAVEAARRAGIRLAATYVLAACSLALVAATVVLAWVTAHH